MFRTYESHMAGVPSMFGKGLAHWHTVSCVLRMHRYIVCARREGRFWVLNTLNSQYVIATFQHDIGRQTLRNFLTVSNQGAHEPPHSIQ
jgi:hypothetical protein